MHPTTLSVAAIVAGVIALQVAGLAVVALVRQAAQHRARLAELGALDPAEADVPAAPAAGPAWAGLRALRVEAIVPEDAAGLVRSFYLAAADGGPLPPFRPGQFLTFKLERGADGAQPAETLVRCYSLSDEPGISRYRISVKRVPAAAPDLPAGRASNHLHDAVRVGDVLYAQAPRGHFVLLAGPRPIVLIAGGIGVTPLLSMAKHSVAQDPARDVHFFYGVRHGGECALRGELEALAAASPAFHLHLCFSDPRGDDPCFQLQAQPQAHVHVHAGRVDLTRLRMSLPAGEHDFYLCGPAPMLESLVPALRGWGVAEARLHFEAFGPSTVARPPGVETSSPPQSEGTSCTVRFSRSGKAVPWEPKRRSLLALAEAHGVVIDSACRSGNCGSCQTRIEAGVVRYSNPPDYDPDPGTCLPCVARPDGDLTLSA